MSTRLVSHILYMCTVIHNCSSLGALAIATDAELYKNVTCMSYSYDTFYNKYSLL